MVETAATGRKIDAHGRHFDGGEPTGRTNKEIEAPHWRLVGAMMSTPSEIHYLDTVLGHLCVCLYTKVALR